jgi:hypothetical protein
MTVKVRAQSRWRFRRRHTIFSPASCAVRIDCRLTIARPCSAGQSLRELSTALKICWTLVPPSNRISGKISHGGCRRAGAHVQGARSCPKASCRRRKCALATDGRMFVLSPRGRRWLTYSFSARARVHQFQRASELNGFYSKAFHASLFQCAARPAVKCIRGSPRTPG